MVAGGVQLLMACSDTKERPDGSVNRRARGSVNGPAPCGSTQVPKRSCGLAWRVVGVPFHRHPVAGRQSGFDVHQRSEAGNIDHAEREVVLAPVLQQYVDVSRHRARHAAVPGWDDPVHHHPVGVTGLQPRHGDVREIQMQALVGQGIVVGRHQSSAKAGADSRT